MKAVTREEQSVAYPLILIFIILSLGIVAGGAFYYHQYERQFRAEAGRQLSAIAELKVDELSQYRKERLWDAGAFFKNEAFPGLVRRFLEHPEDAEAPEQLQEWAAQYLATGQYDLICLFDAQGVIRMAEPAEPPVSSFISQNVSEILRSDRVIFQDFTRSEHDQRAYLSLLVPIFDESGTNRPLGVLALRIDPESYLYPFIQRWPVPSETSETLLVRRDGNDALFLNELKFQTNTALNLRVPLAKTNMPAVMAILGQKGVVEGTDYRGEPSLAALNAVPDSPWFLVTKMDTAEVYAPLRERLRLTILFMGLLLISAGAGIVAVWRHQRVRFYKERYQITEALRESEERFRRVFEEGPTGMALLDETFHFIRANPAFTAMLGYSEAELQKMAFPDITHPDHIQQDVEQVRRLLRGELSAYRTEKRYIAKSGKEIWGQVQVSVVRNADGTFRHFLAVIGNITERKQAEEELRRSEMKFRTLYDLTSDAVMLLNEKGFFDCNQATLALFGCATREEFCSKPPADVSPPVQPDGTDSRTLANQRIATAREKGTNHFEWMHKRVDTGETFTADVLLNAMELDGKPVVQAVVRDITARKQAHDELEKRVVERTAELSQERRLLRTLIDNLPDLVFVKDAQSRFVILNTACTQQLGASRPEEVLGKSDADFVSPELAAQYLADEQELMRSGQMMQKEEPTQHKPSGEMGWSFTTKVPLRDDAGKIVGLMGIARDITKRKQTAEALLQSRDELEKRVTERTAELAGANTTLQQQIAERERIEQVLDRERLLLRTLIDNLPDAIYAKDTAGRKMMANPADLKNLRCQTEAEAMGKSDFDLFPKEIAEQFWADDQKVIQGEPVINREEHFFDEAGRKRWLLTSKLPLRDQTGKIAGLMGIGHDITERKQAEETIARERQLLRTLIDRLPETFYIKDLDSRFLVVNEALAKQSGKAAPAQMLGLSDADLFPAGPAAEFRAEELKVFAGESLIDHENSMVFPDGREHSVLTTKLPFRDSEEQICGLVGIGHDITERKRAEEALRHEQTLMTALMDNIPDAVYFKDAASRFLRVNRALSRKLGLSNPDQIVGKADTDFFTREHARQALTDEQEIVRTGQPLLNAEEKETWPDGTITWVVTTKLPLRDAAGRIIGTCGISLDITERKRVEEALRESVRRLQTVVTGVPIVLYTFDRHGVFTFSEGKGLAGLGLKPGEVVGRSVFEVYRDQPEALANLRRALAGETFTVQLSFPGEATFEVSHTAMRDEAGEYAGTIGLMVDVTERNRAEQILRESQALYYSLAEQLPVGVFRKDREGRFVLVNPEFCRLKGMKAEEFLGKTPREVAAIEAAKPGAAGLATKYAAAGMEHHEQIMQTGKSIELDEEYAHADGTKQFLHVIKLPVLGLSGKIIGTQGIQFDITERKRAEEALQNSRALYFSLVENMPQSVFRKGRDGRFQFVNKRFCQGLKRSPEDIVGRTDADFFPPELAQAYRKGDLRVMETGQVLDQEERHVGADGRELHVHVIKTPLRDAQGQVIGIQGVFWDITERKRTQEMLRLNQERLLKVVMQTRCILSSGQVEGLEGWRERALHPESPFRWDFQVQNEEAAQKILPLELAPGEQYQQAWARSRSHDDHTQMNWNSGNAFLNDLPFYRNEFRCTDKNGVGHWMQQLVTVQKLAENRWEIFGITTDISDLKRVETELRESQALYHSLVEQMPAGIFRKDAKGRYVFVNPTFCRLKEMTPDQFLGKTVLEVGLKDVALAAKGASDHATIMQSGNPIEDDELYSSAAGETRYYRAVKSPVFDFAGKIMGTQGVLFDVTERKRAEEALREAGERFQLVARATNDAVWDWNLTSPAWWNDTFYEIYGFDRNSTPSLEAWASHIHPDDQERVMAGFRAVVEHGEPAWSDEFRFKRADGTYGHVFDRAYSLRDASGKTVRMLGSMMDITERKRAEEALRESEAELRVILESTADGILAVDSKGEKVIKANRQFAELWRVPQSLMDAGNNRALLDFVREQLSEPDTFFKKVQSLYGTNAVATDTLVFKDGRVFEFYTYPMIMDGAVIGRVWSFRDITARKRQEKELSEKSSELERFTYTVSHDLKSPLVTVKTFLGYLEQDMTRPDKERVRQDVAYMHTAADKMGQLLDELLNLARVGRKSNPDERITFKELAQEAVRLVAGRISTGGAEVQVADAAVVLEGDRPRLIEIWQNLVENACKFMGNQTKPRVEIGVEPRGSETVFFVRDNGAGIDPRFQEKVFGLFEKLDPKGEGTGMGLALVKRIVEMYKGRIWVESPGLGQGANFLFTLPGAVIIDPEQSS